MCLLWLRQLPWCGDWTLASVAPPTEGRSSPSNTPVFPPSSSWALHDSVYSYPLVRCSCLLSAGVVCALLCLKVYSWCIHGEMYSTSTSSSTILFSLFGVVFFFFDTCIYVIFFLSFLKKFYLFLAELSSFSLLCMVFSCCHEQGLLFAMLELHIVMAFLVRKHRL